MMKIEVVMTPALYPYRQIKENDIVVMVDILRASTTICTALDHGIAGIKPVATFEEARFFKEKGFLVAAESNGVKPDFADFGNSAFEFMNFNLKNEFLVYCTTNGTKAILLAKDAEILAIGAFCNLTAITEWLKIKKKNVVVLCSGWKNMFNLEDTVFAGALCENLLSSAEFLTDCDGAHASMDLWKVAKDNLMNYMLKATHQKRLQSLKLDNIIPYTFAIDSNKVIPVLQNGWLIDVNAIKENN